MTAPLPAVDLLRHDRDEARDLADHLGVVLSGLSCLEDVLDLPYEDRLSLDVAVAKWNERSWA